jgi:carbamoyltransferase
MYVLGISSFYHDSSACLFKDGELVFACEEEKFTGIKHDSSFPCRTIEYIFEHYNITYDDIHMVCYYEDLNLKLKRVLNNIKKHFITSPKYSITSLFKILKNIYEVKKHLRTFNGRVFYSEHHLAHQYYSFFTSDFETAICLSIDGVGEIDTLSIGLADDEGIEYHKLGAYPHSLGLYYSTMTSFLGFKPNEGEYKLMGLASYGNPQDYIEKVRSLIEFKNGRLNCNMNVFCWDRSNRLMFDEKLSELLGVTPRLVEEEITSVHQNLAAAVQLRYEEVLFDIIKSLKNEGSSNLCLGGGSAYNGTANGKIVSNSDFEKIWIPVAPSDAGSCVGACVHYLVKNKKLKNRVTKNPFLGPKYDIENYLRNLGNLNIIEVTNQNFLLKSVAEKINQGKVVGWYRDRIEFGARALGHRSILANPTIPGMKSRINKLIKKREGFRPFAPMVTKEKQNDFFHVIDDVPYMNQIVKVREEYADKLSAVVHVDGTSRIQTVYKGTVIHDLLLEFEKLSGFPIILNTSFNIKDKTMVLTPMDAIETFKDTDLDLLVIDNYLIYKTL